MTPGHDPVFNGDGPQCPRCKAQVVLWRGEFACSVCGFDSEAWQAALQAADIDFNEEVSA